MDRCDECGSWEAKCSADTPVKGCGCARCLSATVYGLRQELEVAQAFHNVAIRERDLARLELGRAEKRVAALLDQIENEGCVAAHYGERTYECNIEKPCGLCRLRSKANAASNK